jgi:hypothetical protein
LHTVSEAFYRAQVYAYRMNVPVRWRSGPHWSIEQKYPVRVHETGNCVSSIVEHKPSGKLTLYWDMKANTNGDWDACSLVHEVSHLLDKTPPYDVDEIEGPIFAIDYYVMTYLRLPGRLAWINQYDLGDIITKGLVGSMWREVPIELRKTVLQNSLAKAVEKKILDQNGRPVYRRAMETS